MFAISSPDEFLVTFIQIGSVFSQISVSLMFYKNFITFNCKISALPI